MGFLKIDQVVYSGKNYIFESPEFDTGINIIEGKNGTGKTTFSDLICYGLGIYVKQFDRKEKKKHIEICNDEDNYVLLRVEISNKKYCFKRFFGDNRIIVEDAKGNVSVFSIFRSESSPEIFSDWLLSKLNIEVVEIQQGYKKFKINIADLFRLIHYDQNTSPQHIYKEHRTPHNFIADSLQIRKVIFEMLTGYQFNDYYSKLGKLQSLEREKDAAKATLDNYSDVISEMGYRTTELNPDLVIDELTKLTEQLKKVTLYRESIKKSPSNVTHLQRQIQELQNKLFNLENQISRYKNTYHSLSNEIKNLASLKEDMILEVTSIQKILSTQKHLNIFAHNTCPCCLRAIEREENHCVCGKPLDDLEYERFFYTPKEYLDILRSKQRSVLTVEQAIQSCEEDLKSVLNEMNALEIQRNAIIEQIREYEHTSDFYSNDFELTQCNDKILELKDQIQEYEQKQKISEKYSELDKEFNSKKNLYEGLKRQVSSLEDDLSEVITATVSEFNAIYNLLMTDVADDVTEAEIDIDDYMPVINNGVYTQASSEVQKRLMYFFTLFKMSLKIKNMPFPKFLLIDTPENLGIDKENLDKCLEKIMDIETRCKHQILLTTGVGKYPKGFEKFIKLKLSDNDKLLKKRS
ncbi:hypothetical protein PV433_14335 [Paenibacillus sp. GYB004]|uniref:hypothetical protein n=1 Tax=Paenibacillus sp. GYB004 TaxID=2994393 RepID=UPI002F965300